MPAQQVGAGKIGAAARKVINKYKTVKDFGGVIPDDSLTVTADRRRLTRKPPWTGSTSSASLSRPPGLDVLGVVAAYKNLSRVERDIRSVKSDSLDLRPVFDRLEERVKAHVLIGMLAAHLALAPCMGDHIFQVWR